MKTYFFHMVFFGLPGSLATYNTPAKTKGWVPQTSWRFGGRCFFISRWFVYSFHHGNPRFLHFWVVITHMIWGFKPSFFMIYSFQTLFSVFGGVKNMIMSLKYLKYCKLSLHLDLHKNAWNKWPKHIPPKRWFDADLPWYKVKKLTCKQNKSKHFIEVVSFLSHLWDVKLPRPFLCETSLCFPLLPGGVMQPDLSLKNPRLFWTPCFWRYDWTPKTNLKSPNLGRYCWWKKTQTTTWHETLQIMGYLPHQPVRHRIFFPSTVWSCINPIVFQANTCRGKSSFGSLFFGGVQSNRTKRQGVQWEA